MDHFPYDDDDQNYYPDDYNVDDDQYNDNYSCTGHSDEYDEDYNTDFDEYGDDYDDHYGDAFSADCCDDNQLNIVQDSHHHNQYYAI